MKNMVSVIIGASICLWLPYAAWSAGPGSSPVKPYTVKMYVRQQEGMYAEQAGLLEKCAKNYLVLRSSDGAQLYTRDVVKLVELPPDYPDAECKRIVNTHWNKEGSLLVEALLGIEVIGKSLTFLRNLPRIVDTVISFLILTAFLTYVGYKAYESLVVAGSIRNLSSSKLNLEIIKLKHEIQQIRRTLGMEEEPLGAPAGEGGARPAAIAPPITAPRINITAFIKHKVLRLPTRSEEEASMKGWSDRWQRHRDKGRWLNRLHYGARYVVNLSFTILLALLLMGSVADIFLMAEEGAGMSLVFFLTAVASLIGLLRLNTQRRIIRASYRNYREALRATSG